MKKNIIKIRISIVLTAAIAILCLCCGLAACSQSEQQEPEAGYINVSFYDGDEMITQKIMSINETFRYPSVDAPDGYTEGGWYFDKDEWTEELNKQSLGEYIDAGEKKISVFVKFVPIEYQIVYENVVSENAEEIVATLPSTYTVESDTITIPAISVPYYVFDGWLSGGRQVEEITAGTTGDLVLTAKLTPVEYTISYSGTEGAYNSNPTSYNIESGEIVFSSAAKAGYKFEGWYYGDDEITSIPANSHGDVTLEAKWSLITYEITYEQTHGADTSSLPATYTVESDTITIPTIRVQYYVFDGWFSDGRQVEEIAAGTTGDLVLTAKLTPVEYTISYSGTEGAYNSNPTSYNIESGEIVFSVAVKEGYNFEGWYYGGYEITSIPANKHGDVTLEATWSLITYEITYEQTHGADTSSLPATYTVESDTITIPTISVLYYVFGGWFSGGRQVEEIAAGTTGDLVLTAKLTPVEYTISYSGTEGAYNSNPTSYNIESGEIVFSSAVKAGYNFEGWYDGDGEIESIPANSYGDVTLEAKWSLITYEITYEQTYDADTSAFPATYTVESDTIVLPNDVEVICRIFKGWRLNGESVSAIPTGTTGDLVLTATYDINHTIVTDDAVAPTCEETGLTQGSHCSVCGDVIEEQLEISALGHDYAATWTWDGYTSAQLLLTCRHDGSHTLTVSGKIETETTAATCSQDGCNTYTATAEYNGVSYTDKKTENIAAIAHDFRQSSTDSGKHVCSMCNLTEDHVDKDFSGTCSVCGSQFATYIKISTYDGLLEIKNDMSASYVLTADVTLTGTWASLGSSSVPFTGKLYGNGHTITGLTMNNVSTDSGLFVRNDGLIDGLTLSGMSIMPVVSNKSGTVSVVCGGIAAYNYGTIRNCNIVGGNSIGSKHNMSYSNNSTVTSTVTYTIGSLCGINEKGGVIEGCTVGGTMTNDFTVYNSDGGSGIVSGNYKATCTVYFGNIAGVNEGTIRNSEVDAVDTVTLKVTAYTSAGGIEAYSYLYCYAGSLVGDNRSTVTGCKAKAYTKSSNSTTSATVGYGVNYNKAEYYLKQAPSYEGFFGANTGTISGFERIEG